MQSEDWENSRFFLIAWRWSWILSLICEFLPGERVVRSKECENSRFYRPELILDPIRCYAIPPFREKIAQSMEQKTFIPSGISSDRLILITQRWFLISTMPYSLLLTSERKGLRFSLCCVGYRRTRLLTLTWDTDLWYGVACPYRIPLPNLIYTDRQCVTSSSQYPGLLGWATSRAAHRSPVLTTSSTSGSLLSS